ncbi:unnamed protein product [Owenia fusiformis]|uniref:Anion exchange protein n=1 Tax=Owenia fusiformis TaxID=6347 RepID=A0A8J1UHY5_OWEFU|nr:unnamed protein product [Owenia fusiformis]
MGKAGGVEFSAGAPSPSEGESEERPLFSELQEYYQKKGEYEEAWHQEARWIKYEENVEASGERWTKPHVASLSLQALYRLKHQLNDALFLLDVKADTLGGITDVIKDAMIEEELLSEEQAGIMEEIIMQPHWHKHQLNHERRESKAFARRMSHEGLQLPSTGSFPRRGSITPSGNSTSFSKSDSSGGLKRVGSQSAMKKFQRKIPEGAEGASVMVGGIDGLDKTVTALVRLKSGVDLMELMEVELPTRFIFVMFGPKHENTAIKQVGRCMGTIFSHKDFQKVVYSAKDKKEILASVDAFMQDSTVLPASEWDHNIHIQPPTTTDTQGKTWSSVLKEPEEGEEEIEDHADPTLVRTGRIFGGLVNDVKRKAKWYASDFKDALSLQSLASIFFIYFACLSTVITFGGMMGDALDNKMAAAEGMLAAGICGVSYSLLAGQPLTILGCTGPILVFETILYNFCKDNGMEYLPFRFWIGIWTGAILLIMVMFDLSALVKYITKFTEEVFAVLISLIFIYESLSKVIKVNKKYPMRIKPDEPLGPCTCHRPDPVMTTVMPGAENSTMVYATTLAPGMNKSLMFMGMSLENMTDGDWAALSHEDCLEYGGKLVGPGCKEYFPDVFLFSFILCMGVFVIAMGLKGFKETRYFPTFVRQNIADFAVPIALVIMTGIDLALGLHTPKLQIPTEFRPTLHSRGWVIPPFGANAWWTALAAGVPAILLSILIFMDQQITSVIVNNKANKLKKGGGYHLDLLIISVQVVLCSVMGIPYFVAATVRSINHVLSLRKESKNAAPGEKPKFLGIREQRVTHVVAFTVIGFSIFMNAVLKYVPMPVLYGVFLYMGVASLSGAELVQRMLLVFMPRKYQPDHKFLRHVDTNRVHLFTAIQVTSLAILWVVKSVKKISIIFPLMVLALCFVRKGMEWIFTEKELKHLDNLLPAMGKKKEPEDKTELEKLDPYGSHA